MREHLEPPDKHPLWIRTVGDFMPASCHPFHCSRCRVPLLRRHGRGRRGRGRRGAYGGTWFITDSATALITGSITRLATSAAAVLITGLSSGLAALPSNLDDSRNVDLASCQG